MTRHAARRSEALWQTTSRYVVLRDEPGQRPGCELGIQRFARQPVTQSTQRPGPDVDQPEPIGKPQRKRVSGVRVRNHGHVVPRLQQCFDFMSSAIGDCPDILKTDQDLHDHGRFPIRTFQLHHPSDTLRVTDSGNLPGGVPQCARRTWLPQSGASYDGWIHAAEPVRVRPLPQVAMKYSNCSSVPPGADTMGDLQEDGRRLPFSRGRQRVASASRVSTDSRSAGPHARSGCVQTPGS